MEILHWLSRARDSYDEQKGAEIENKYALIGVSPCKLTPEEVIAMNQATGGHEDPNECQQVTPLQLRLAEIDAIAHGTTLSPTLRQQEANQDFSDYQNQTAYATGYDKTQYLDFSFRMFDVCAIFHL